MSKLITEVCKITEIIVHPNADKLEIATVKGWQCIIQKDSYKINDLIIFIQPDTIVPESLIKQFNLEFLRKNGRVGIVKLRGIVSYGLIIDNCLGLAEGSEVSSILGLTKYEQQDVYEASPMSGQRKTSRKKLNPHFFKYCDIENSKNYPDLFSEEDEVVVTEKIHGANFRCGWLKRKQTNWFDCIWAKIFGEYEFVYGSRTVQISGNINYKGFYGTDVYGFVAHKHLMATHCKLYPDYEFFGEVYGPKIQDLNYSRKEIDLILFDIKDTVTERYLNWDEFNSIMTRCFLPSVPVMYRGRFDKDLILSLATGNSLLDKTQIKEGVVVKTIVEKPSKIGRTVSKFINPDYYTRLNGTENK